MKRRANCSLSEAADEVRHNLAVGMSFMEALRDASETYGESMAEIATECAKRSARKRQFLAQCKLKAEELQTWQKIVGPEEKGLWDEFTRERKLWEKP